MDQISNDKYPRVLYSLKVKTSDGLQYHIPILEDASIGKASDNQVIIGKEEILDKHGIFRSNQDILSFLNLGPDTSVKINTTPIMHGKMYVLDKGDSIELQSWPPIIIERTLLESEKDFSKMLSGLDSSTSELKDLDSLLKPKKSEKVSLNKKEKETEIAPPSPLIVEKKKTSEKPNKKSFSLSNSQNIFARLLSAILTFLLVYISTFNLFPFLREKTEFFLKVEIIFQKLSPSFKDLPLNITSEGFLFIFTAFLVWVIIELLSHIVFASPLFYFCLGFRQRGSFLSNRIKAVFRWFFSTITTPFLIFDLPILIQKRPLKEIASGVYYHQIPRFKASLSFFILTPLILITAVSLPLIAFNDFREAIPFQIIPQEKIKTETGSLISSLFNLEISKSFLNDLDLIPIFKINKKNEKIRIGLRIHQKESKRQATLLYKGTISIPELQEKALSLVPFNIFAVDLDQEKKFEEFMRDSLSLTLENAHQHIMKNGPVLVASTQFRDLLLQKLHYSQNNILEYYQYKKSFTLYNSHIKNKKYYSDYYLSHTPIGLKVFELRYTKKSEKISQYWRKKVLQSSHYSIKKNKDHLATNNFFIILDLISKINENHSLPEKKVSLLFSAINSFQSNSTHNIKKNILEVLGKLKEKSKNKEQLENIIIQLNSEEEDLKNNKINNEGNIE